MIESLVAPAVSGDGGYRELLCSGQLLDEPFTSTTAAAAPLKLWCSLGGRILPRDPDKSLTYSGGDSRLVTVDRRVSLADLTAIISNAFYACSPFVLKYQLPNEDLDFLISLINDEDLENMIEEYDRTPDSPPAGRPSDEVTVGEGSSQSGRLRLFLFLAKTDSAPAPAIRSLLGNAKSENWFIDAFNNAMDDIGINGIPRGLSADVASVDSLLGLADYSSVRCLVGSAHGNDSGGGLSKSEQIVCRQGQEVQSVPDSPLLDHLSSFGSDSSAPPLSSLPPIRLEVLSPVHRMAGLEDHFLRFNLSSHAATTVAPGDSDDGLEEIYLQPAYAAKNQPPSSFFLPNSPTSTSISPTENRAFSSSDDNKSDHGGSKEEIPSVIDAAAMPCLISRPAYADINSDLQKALPVSSGPGLQMPAQVSNSSAGYPSQAQHFLQEQHQQQQAHHHSKQQQQQQFIPVVTHCVHQPVTGAVYPMPPYYQVFAHPIQQPQQAHPYSQQIPMYYMQIPQDPYYMAALQPNATNSNSMTSAGMTVLPVPQANYNPEPPKSMYGTVVAPPSHAGLQPQVIPLAAEQAHSYAGIRYQFVLQHHLAQPPATTPSYAYQYAADPAQSHLYYSQATLPLASAPEYKTVSSTAVNIAMAPMDIRPTRM